MLGKPLQTQGFAYCLCDGSLPTSPVSTAGKPGESIQNNKSDYPFAYEFIDQEYEQLYRNEQVIARLSNAFSALAMSISCLGLLGLVMFSAGQRTKEFGIRKVLGATVINILGLLSEGFIQLVFISFCIAAPLAGYFMYQWLQTFAFKIELSWWIFALAGGAALLITSVVNPVKSLREG